LIARPDQFDRAKLYLQLNQTHESFRVSPIGSAIPNRGFGQGDINLYGVDYLQKIHDAGTAGALQFEPGLWVYQPDPPTTFPAENVDPAQLVHRMGSIPHGNAVLASGTAQPFTGPPALPAGNAPYNGSIFPSFSTPFGAGGPLQMVELDFPIFTLLNPPAGGPLSRNIDLGWPHISVATLRKSFNA
jgi:hypothetical protein